MENVDRIIKSKVWKNAQKILKDGGYGLTENILDASYCGCPQIRKIFFCIGILNKNPRPKGRGFLLIIIILKTGKEMNEEYIDFQTWLQNTKSLTKNSATDVVSRIKRAKKIMDIDVPIDIDTLLFHFTEKPTFKALTITVKSQLKRAIKLYMEFKS